MNFNINRKLREGRFLVSVTYKSYGDEAMSPEEEQSVFKSLGYPRIDAGGLFEGKFGYDPELNRVIRDEYGSDVRILLNSKTVTVDEGFEAQFLVHVDRISESDLTPSLPTKEYVAEARCLLVEEEILKRIEKDVWEIKNRATSFIDGYPKLTII